MTVFWRPLLLEKPQWDTRKRYKFLGHGAYEMWCRCDLCFRSGPSTGFVFLERNGATGEMCEDCAGNRLTMSELYADGWKKR
jgi:hypothetical protein